MPLRRLVHHSRNFAEDLYNYLLFRSSWFRGVYATFEEAQAAAPRGMTLGFDHENLAEHYRQRFASTLHAGDYVILYHLSRILVEHRPTVVLDFGGNIGMHFLRFRGHLDLGAVRWIVCEVPQIAKAGRALCAGIPNVAFVTDIGELRGDRVDVLVANDSLHYVEPLPALLQRLIDQGTPPRHVLVDWLPLCDGPCFVTLQSDGITCYPHAVFNRSECLSAVARVGYAIDDSWEDDPGPSPIPFHRDRSFGYHGMRLHRTIGAGSVPQPSAIRSSA